MTLQNLSISSILIKQLIIIISLVLILTINTVNGYDVIYAVNAGGDTHIDRHGIRYQKDPLMGRTGTASDFGQLLLIGRVHQSDEILYQTERYHTSTFGYDLPASGDGEYLLILKFCEVYFNEPNQKVFDVVLNGHHKVVPDLDIFNLVGKGIAHDEHVYFNIKNNRLYFNDEVSEIRGGKFRVEFIKGYRDNPKVNAILLLNGDLEEIPELSTIDEEMSSQNQQQTSHQEKMHQQMLQQQQQQQEIDEKELYDQQNQIISDTLDNKQSSTAAKSRKTSGPKQPNPYSLDDASIMLPVFIAIGTFVPLLFFLCKL